MLGGDQVDGDANDDVSPHLFGGAPLRRKRRRAVADPVAPVVMRSGPLTLCFHVASQCKKALGHIRGEIEHPGLLADWPDGAEVIVGAVLLRWHLESTNVVADLPTTDRDTCTETDGRKAAMYFLGAWLKGSVGRTLVSTRLGTQVSATSMPLWHPLTAHNQFGLVQAISACASRV